MIALGWTKCTRTALENVAFHAIEGDYILVGPTNASATAKDRLRLQMHCYKAGIDFLPTCPGAPLSVGEAAKFYKSADLAEHITALAEQGQFTLALTAPPQPITHASGRAWLADRRSYHAKLSQNSDFLKALVQDLGFATSPLRQSKDVVHVDILVPRHRAHSVRAQMAATALKLGDKVDAKLAITGLWPPYSFCDWQSALKGAA